MYYFETMDEKGWYVASIDREGICLTEFFDEALLFEEKEPAYLFLYVLRSAFSNQIRISFFDE